VQRDLRSARTHYFGRTPALKSSVTLRVLLEISAVPAPNCMKTKSFVATATLSAAAIAAHAQDASDADALAKQLSNPVSALISVPLQANWDTGMGDTGDGERWTMNLQPVIPIGISEHWNMISRTIAPLIDQRDVIADGSQSGLGDITQSLFFSPKQPTANGWIWGVGPALLLPTATDDLLGAEQWAVGPTVVMLKQTPTGWTYGALVNHLWSVAGEDDRADINGTFMQPFVSKGLGQGRTLTLNMESTYDWHATQWNVPVNLSYTKVTTFGKQRISWGAGARAYLESPDGGADWGLRVIVTLLFPE
jgi:hypothetical protein